RAPGPSSTIGRAHVVGCSLETPARALVTCHSLQVSNPLAELRTRHRSRHRIGGGSESLTPLNNYFFVARRLVAATLLARDPSAVVPFNRGSFHAAVLSWTDGDTTWADANCGVGVVPPTTIPIVAVVAVPPDLNIDALGHLDALGLGR